MLSLPAALTLAVLLFLTMPNALDAAGLSALQKRDASHHELFPSLQKRGTGTNFDPTSTYGPNNYPYWDQSQGNCQQAYLQEGGAYSFETLGDVSLGVKKSYLAFCKDCWSNPDSIGSSVLFNRDFSPNAANYDQWNIHYISPTLNLITVKSLWTDGANNDRHWYLGSGDTITTQGTLGLIVMSQTAYQWGYIITSDCNIKLYNQDTMGALMACGTWCSGFATSQAAGGEYTAVTQCDVRNPNSCYDFDARTKLTTTKFN